MKKDKSLTPWHDECGNLKFSYRAILDRVFIFPSPPPERYRSKEKLIEIPSLFRKYYNRGEGILLSVGPGYYDDKGKWHPTTDQLKPGLKVSYDNSVPWRVQNEGLDGKEYLIVLCGASDVYGVLEE